MFSVSKKTLTQSVVQDSRTENDLKLTLHNVSNLGQILQRASAKHRSSLPLPTDWYKFFLKAKGPKTSKNSKK